MDQEISQTVAAETPISSSSSLKYAGFWRRYFAYAIDTMIIGIVNASIGMSFAFAMKDGQGLIFLPSLLISIGYFVYFWSKQGGQTLGNRILAIKVAREDGKTIDPMTGVVRYLGYIISGAVFSLGFLWTIWDSKKQGWHDKIAKTVVYETGEKPKKGLVALIFGLQFLLFLGIIAAIFVFAVLVAKVAKEDPDKMKSVMTSIQKEVAEQDPDSEFAQSLNEALVLEQDDVDELASEVFAAVNVKRAEMSVEPITQEGKMCAYAQRRLTQLEELGKFDDGKGFYEDMGNPDIARAYFTGYGQIRTHVYQLSSILPGAVEVMEFWHGDGTESIVTDAILDDGCVRGDSHYLVIVAAEKI